MCVADEIAREIKKQAQSTVGQALLGTGLALGTITPTMKLKLDDFKYELEFIQIETANEIEIEPGELNGALWYNTKYDVMQDKIKAKVKERLILEPGDRVLVAIVNGGIDHIIVGKVV